MSSIEFTGKFHFDAASAKIQQAIHEGVVLVAEAILTESNAHVPHEEGTLEGSGKVEVVTSSSGESTMSISYDTVYAQRQHEELTWQHDDGRTAKYLENAIDEVRPLAPAIVANRVRKVT